MSNKLNDLLKGLKNLVMEAVDEPTVQKFEKISVDGVEVQIDVVSREVGSDVNVIDSEGNATPAPDGEYELTDGFKFTVLGGKISEIVEEKPAEDAPVSEEMAEDNAPAESNDLQSEVDALKAEVEALKEAIKAITDKPESPSQEDFNQFKTDFNNQESQFNKLVEALEKLPVQFSKVDNSPKGNNKKAEDLARLGNALKK